MAQIAPGTLLGGQYTVLHRVAENEYATVYKAIDIKADGKPVAIKAVSASSDDGVAQELFRRELDSLGRLRHDNIVLLLGDGRDPEHGRWLALEWIDGGSLALATTKAKFTAPDVHLLTTGALLDALAFAHHNRVLHRDIKPANILCSADGTAKLADFNVSKVLRRATATRTVKHIFTAEYAAPEQRADGSATERSDVYSLGKVLSELIAGVPTGESDQDVLRALGATPMRGPLKRLLRRMMSPEPTDRPTALQASREVEALLLALRPMPRLALQATTSAMHAIRSVIGTSMTDHETRVATDADLAGPLLVKVRTQPARKGSGTVYSFLGRRLSFLVDATINSFGEGSEMVIIGAAERDPAWEERDRNAAVELPMTCELFADVAPVSFANDAAAFVDLHRQYTQERGSAATDDRHKQWQVAQWRDYLGVMQEIAQRNGVIGLLQQCRERREDQLLELTIQRNPDTSPTVEEARISVQLATATRTIPMGVVIESRGSTLIVSPDHDFPQSLALPPGTIVMLDVQQQTATLRRQTAALNTLEDRADANGDLIDLVVFPNRIAAASPLSFSPKTIDLDPENRAVVEAALGTDRMFVVQGPPGTGKTTVIAELVAQILERERGSRILLVSQSNVAVDNVLERLADLVGAVPAVRLGRPEKVAPAVRTMLLETRLREETAAVRGRASHARDLLDALPRNKSNLTALSDLWAAAKAKTADRTEVRRLAQEQLGAAAVGSDEELDERIRAALEAAGQPAEWQRRRRLLQEQWIERLHRSGELESILFANMRVIAGTCVGVIASPAVAKEEFEWVIVDEAGRASAPELLVPLVRGKRIVLVGDHRQLPPILDREALGEVFDDDIEARAAFEKSLFETLFNGVPAGAKLALKRQYRMHPTIAGLIEECFYPAGLADGVTAEERPFGVQLWKVPLRWLDTSTLGTDEIRRGTSFSNPEEGRIIMRDLRHTLSAAAQSGLPSLSIGILTGYARQVETLADELRQATLPRSGDRVEVLSVDASQGKEFDLVYYSTVRSNREGKIGFLQDERRLNVALSRAKHGLTIVGNLRCVRDASSRFGPNPFIGVGRYIRQAGNDRAIMTVKRNAD